MADRLDEPDTVVGRIAARPPCPAPTRIRACRIVVVDDSPLFRATAENLLAEMADIEVVGLAGSGPEALEVVAGLAPDLVLTDLEMPGMNGLELARRLAAGPRPPCVVVMTLYDQPWHGEAARAKGAHGFVRKTDLVEDLESMIRGLLPGQDEAV